MRQYGKIAVFFAIVAVLALASYLLRRAAAPESTIIAMERDRIARAVDRGRAEKDPLPLAEGEEKLRLLEYRLAIAYNREGKPDAAISVLRTLIEKLDAVDPDRKRGSTFTDEARYYEALAASYEMKKDEASARKAREARQELLSKAAESRKQEFSGEGRRVGSPAD